jgi:hypothetical protein
MLGCSGHQEPSPEELCGAVRQNTFSHIQSDNNKIKSCLQGSWRKNDAVALECILILATVEDKKKAVNAEVKNCRKFSCKPAEKENEYLCDYYLELTTSNFKRPYKNHPNQNNNGHKTDIFKRLGTGWDVYPVPQKRINNGSKLRSPS